MVYLDDLPIATCSHRCDPKAQEMSRKVADLEAKLLLGPRDRRAEKELGVGQARYYILYNFCIIYIYSMYNMYIVYILYSIYIWRFP